MNNSDDERDYCFYGTALEPIEEESDAKRKPINIEDQVATDEYGRRRFHGAFTGGFSAGYFNTVGTLEGWLPDEFKSSKSKRADAVKQRPEDFMDSEDMSEFGIAPKVLQTTDDYSNNLKRKKSHFVDGPIPGEPVLCKLLESIKDTIGVRLLKKMGWKPGQGIGPRIRKSEKRRQQKEKVKIYGCELPKELQKHYSDSESDSDIDVTFAPDDYDSYVCNPKINRWGMGYSGLGKEPILSNLNSLFEPKNTLLIKDKNKKKTISGQAFGVGAFEEEDEDIYNKQDMSHYDFELDCEERYNKSNVISNIIEPNSIEGFNKSKNCLLILKQFPAPLLPSSFVAKHGERKSRFDPLPESHQLHDYDRKKEKFQRKISAETRSKILKETEVISSVNVQEKRNDKNIINSKIENVQYSSYGSDGFKPFAFDPEKQKRYDLFVKSNKKNFCLEAYQPFGMTKSEREQEKYEFEQADRLYNKTAVMDKFVHAEKPDDFNNPLAQVEKSDFYLYGTKEMRDAVKMKMFGNLTRKIDDWIPNALLCKRFNVPEIKKSISCNQLPNVKKPLAIFDFGNVVNEYKNYSEKSNNFELKATQVQSKNLELISNHAFDFNEHEKESTNSKTTHNLIDVIDTKSNMDLYNSIFNDSSSDNEDECAKMLKNLDNVKSTEVINNEQFENLKEIVLKDSYCVQKSSMPISDKKGILSNIDFDKMKMTNSSQLSNTFNSEMSSKLEKRRDKDKKSKKSKKSKKEKPKKEKSKKSKKKKSEKPENKKEKTHSKVKELKS